MNAIEKISNLSLCLSSLLLSGISLEFKRAASKGGAYVLSPNRLLQNKQPTHEETGAEKSQ